MEYGYSILMFIFSGALLLYAALIALTGSTGLIPRQHSVKTDNPRRYARRFAGVLALTALAPAHSGLIALWLGPGIWAVVSLPAAFAVCLWAGTKLMEGGD